MSNETVNVAAQADTLFNFPCEFPIKIMGENLPEFTPAVLAILRQHVGEFDEAQLLSCESRSGKYVSLTATFVAHSREQLDALYLALTSHAMIKAVL